MPDTEKVLGLFAPVDIMIIRLDFVAVIFLKFKQVYLLLHI